MNTQIDLVEFLVDWNDTDTDLSRRAVYLSFVPVCAARW